MWRWSIWRFWLSHIRNYTTMGRYSVGERQWQSRSMLATLRISWFWVGTWWLWTQTYTEDRDSDREESSGYTHGRKWKVLSLSLRWERCWERETWLTGNDSEVLRRYFVGGSTGKGFLYCGFGFVYKSIRIPRRTVAGVVLRERDNR